ncbi:uncharacterized protein LOC122519155 [Polistes fuscatus]|uniref:uncharacterized protein LOC122519155 n=1 Tax=Polistes fuscatus TaxID=30207 RepID=UPI001CA98B6D|nr:uncharacterized protein LOC122519155 [Polistes fuscatus]XP_043494384.1 uncharacterized protein LOC122519155 [Polistes fuscatus]
MARLKGWRYGIFVGSFVGAIGAYLCAVLIHPMMNPNHYKQIRTEANKYLPPDKIV